MNAFRPGARQVPPQALVSTCFEEKTHAPSSLIDRNQDGSRWEEGVIGLSVAPGLDCLGALGQEVYLVLWQSCEGCNDGSQRNLALLGQVRRAGEGVGGAAHEPGTGVPCEGTNQAGNQPKLLSLYHLAGTAPGLTLVLNGEAGGDQRWNLTSDICGVDLRAVLGLVVLNHLGLQSTPVLCSRPHRRRFCRESWLLHSLCWGWSLGPVSSEVVPPVLQVLQEKPLACPAGAQPWAPQTALLRRAERVLVGGLVQKDHRFDSPSHFCSYLLAGGIQVEQQLRDRSGNHWGLEERAQGRDYPCPP